jgi:hypothetical protein
LQVKLTGDREEGMKMLDEVVVPQARAMAGFQPGTWMHNADMTGTGVVVFDTEEHATAAMEALQPPPDGPTVINCAVFEIARDV